jgi:hypothetical protein
MATLRDPGFLSGIKKATMEKIMIDEVALTGGNNETD